MQNRDLRGLYTNFTNLHEGGREVKCDGVVSLHGYKRFNCCRQGFEKRKYRVKK